MQHQPTVLITGGTGSFGHACTRTLLERGARVIVFSRDELKQFEMRRTFAAAAASDQLRFFIGDVREPARVRRAFEARPDLVIHAAALKQVDTCGASLNGFSSSRLKTMTRAPRSSSVRVHAWPKDPVPPVMRTVGWCCIGAPASAHETGV